MYPVELIEIQIKFAKKAQELENISFSNALLRFTAIARFIGIKYSEMSVENTTWVKLLSSLTPLASTYEQAQAISEFKNKHNTNSEDNLDINGNPRAEFGCFNFDYKPEEKQIQLHFSNNQKGEPGPLSKQNMPQRLNELKEMFTFIKNTYPEAEKVRGHSWLYSIEAYRRLFPKEYLDSTSIKQTFLNTSMWGQFLDNSGRLKEDLANDFVINVNKAQTIEELKSSFPYQQPKVTADISYFYNFYKIS